MGKKIIAARKLIDQDKYHTLEEAVDILKKGSFVKFDETLEVAINLGVDPKHSDQMVRGMVSLPAGTGKSVRVAVVCKEDKIDMAKKAGADLAGGAELIEDIKASKIDFEVCIATPDMMGMVGQVARILGPKGLMPNPKLGTVTQDIESAVKKAKSGQVEYRVEKAGIVHAGVGKVSFSAADLLKNAKYFIESVIKAKPSGVKGTYLQKIYLSTTMGCSVKIDPASVSQ
ncbi:MAG: 50S ribosomal protein L1 [Rickettsiaceae bacterium]|nr:50S ribosomal protein L1 [Rickettsiaceae bacterium]